MWRLQNGELDNLSPKVTRGVQKALDNFIQVIVLSVGQNNIGNTAEEIGEGVKEICGVIRSKQPQAFLVLLVRRCITWSHGHLVS